MKIANLYGHNITVSGGETHDYLGMDFDYSTKGVVKVSMIKYLLKIFKDFPEIIKSTHNSSASENLFRVHPAEERKLLPEEQVQAFHHAVAQLIFLAMRARPDILVPVPFLTK